MPHTHVGFFCLCRVWKLIHNLACCVGAPSPDKIYKSVELSCSLVVFNWKESNKCDLCQACQLLITYLCDKGSGCRTLLGAVATLMKCGRDGQRFRKNYSSVWRPAPVNFKKRIDLRLVSPFPNGGNERILELASVNLRFSTIIYDDLPLSTIIYVQR